MVKIEKFNIVNILNLNIEKSINNHTRCYFQILIKEQWIPEYENCINKSFQISSNIEEEILFRGFVHDVSIERKRGKTYVEIEAFSFSYKEDMVKHTRIFQDCSSTIKTIVQKLEIDYLTIVFIDKEFQNKKIEVPLFQFEESNFQFLKRLSSMKGLPMVVDDISEENPYIWIGKRKGKSIDLELQDFKLTKGINKSVYELIIDNFLEIGDFINMNNSQFYVISSHIFLNNGLLKYRYELVEFKEYEEALIKNKSIAGRSFETEVINNIDKENKGRLQVKFNFEEENSSNSYWYKNASLFSSAYGGMHFLPNIGDKVLVFFPSENEEEAFVSGSVRNEAIEKFENPKEKILRNDNGEEIIIGENFIKIALSNSEKFIELNEESIILKNSNSFIEIKKDEINISCENSTIQLNKDVLIKGSKIKLN